MAMATHKLGLETGKKAMESGEQADEIAADGHEHQKKMDKEGLKIDAKKADKPSAKPTRSLDEWASEILRGIEDEMTLYRHGGGNPNHVSSGPAGGQFYFWWRRLPQPLFMLTESIMPNDSGARKEAEGGREAAA